MRRNFAKTLAARAQLVGDEKGKKKNWIFMYSNNLLHRQVGDKDVKM